VPWLLTDCPLLKCRGVFVKTVFSAFERFDSVQARIDADTVSLICQKIVANLLRESSFPWEHARPERLLGASWSLTAM
jgi:hypothetical protein